MGPWVVALSSRASNPSSALFVSFEEYLITKFHRMGGSVIVAFIETFHRHSKCALLRCVCVCKIMASGQSSPVQSAWQSCLRGRLFAHMCEDFSAQSTCVNNSRLLVPPSGSQRTRRPRRVGAVATSFSFDLHTRRLAAVVKAQRAVISMYQFRKRAGWLAFG